MNRSRIRILAIAIWVIFLFPGAGPLQPKKNQDNGIHVYSVSTYDEGYLETQLNKAVANLGALNAFDAAAIKQLGLIQGSTASQTGVSVTAGNGTAPTQSTPSTYNLPSNVAPSAVDFLNEELQLGLQIINTQLLLQGALNDQSAQGDPEKQRVRTTLGLPINITAPEGFQYQGAVAEVEVSVCSPSNTDGSPTLSILLPQEKTYNVASIVSKNTSLGVSASIASVVSFGGSFLRGRQSYYLVRDQDTVALQRPPDGACGNGHPPLTFAWQFRPVLGQKAVRTGLRQTFAQISFPRPKVRFYALCDLHATIKTSWRRYDAHTGRVGARIDEPRTDPPTPVENFGLPPVARSVDIQDNGDGNVTVVAYGAFRPNTSVRIGGTVLDSSSAGFQQNTTYIRFVAPASSLALNPAMLLNTDGSEWQVVPPKSGRLDTSCRAVADLQTGPDRDAQHLPVSAALVAYRAPVRDQAVDAPGAVGAPAAAPAAAPVAAPHVSVRPFDTSSSLVILWFSTSQPPNTARPDVVLIGNKTFGLRDAPFYERTDDHVTVLVPNTLLGTARTLTWKNLMDETKKIVESIPFYPPQLDGASDFSITAITALTSTGGGGGSGTAKSSSSAADVVVGVQPAAPGAPGAITGAGLLTIGDGTPAITSISPAGAQRGETVRVMVTGAFTQFTDKTQLKFDDPKIRSSIRTVPDPNHLLADIVVPADATPGSATLSLKSGSETLPATFTIGNATARVTKVEPDNKGPDLILVITGDESTRFDREPSRVKFSNPGVTVRDTVVAGPHVIRALVAIDPKASGFSDVTVVSGSQTATGTNVYHVNPSIPLVVAVNPAAVKPGDTLPISVYTDPPDSFTDPPTLKLKPDITVTDVKVSGGHLTTTISAPSSTPQKAANMFAIIGSGLSRLRIVQPAVDLDYTSDTLVNFSLTDNQVQQTKNLEIEFAPGRRILYALPPATPPSPPAKSITPQPAAGIPLTQTSLALTGTGMTQIISVRYNDQPLTFDASSDTKLTLQLTNPQTSKSILSPPAVDVVFVYTDNTKYQYRIPVAGASK